MIKENQQKSVFYRYPEERFGFIRKINERTTPRTHQKRNNYRMPYQIEWHEEGVMVYFWGIFDHRTNTEAFLSTVHSNEIRRTRYIFWDLSKVTEHLMSEEETIVSVIDKHLLDRVLPPIKMAFLVNDPIPRRLPRLFTARYHSQKIGWEFLISNDKTTIYDWIKV